MEVSTLPNHINIRCIGLWSYPQHSDVLAVAMKKSIVNFILVVSLFSCLFLVFRYPHLMISPGNLMEGHQDLTLDCFTCHSLFRGNPSEKCISCHKIDDIGLVTTKGVKIQKREEIKTSFHQELVKKDCVTCHSDHQGIMVYQTIQYFSHELLSQTARKNCHTCHEKPKDPLHRNIPGSCVRCHRDEKWGSPLFEHEFLTRSVRVYCDTCHENPKDPLHEKITGNCGLCHDEKEWAPTTFEHDLFFQLDRDHDTKCMTCHIKNDYGQYSCYECHEHSPSNTREEHHEEGIYDYEKCTECHLSADEDEAKRLWYSKKRILKNDYQKFNRKYERYDDDEEEEHEDHDD